MNLEDIIKGCRNNNRKAQEELYHLYKGVLFSLCLKYCRNDAEAEDNLHNSFIEIFAAIHKYRGAGTFEGWIKRITINKAINSYKKTLQVVPLKDNFTGDTDVGTEEMTISADIILEFVQQLPDQYRIIFCLYELDDYPHKEIATMLSISESTSKSNLHRAKAILQNKIRATKNVDTIQNHGS
ncbi:sigma-70 family RNA polymerase sigma factor [Flavobacterium sp. DG1-102-2]|uniref:RNA polymerase sigma factor n=1 Tax=Flavobacterium sp. DG1-102-2 TaxID=3081663 RepID=UPI002949F63F|nr:sigma-70 family RNA polymerase sigma factor [Flavobacterium sp. DG1-102-2]MDV6168851.1 sigma-70 family RNA polymerase sigma factor [Flavobacterium sp. DG1-102-2]